MRSFVLLVFNHAYHCRVVNGGVRVFAEARSTTKQKEKGITPTAQYRLTQEGVRYLGTRITKYCLYILKQSFSNPPPHLRRVIRISFDQFRKLLSFKDSQKFDVMDEGLRDTAQKLGEALFFISNYCHLIIQRKEVFSLLWKQIQRHLKMNLQSLGRNDRTCYIR